MVTKRRVYGCRKDFSSSVCRSNVRQPLTTLIQNLATIEPSSAGVNQQSKPGPLTSSPPPKKASASNKKSDKRNSKTTQRHKFPRGKLGKQGNEQQQGPTLKGKRRSMQRSNDIHSNSSRIKPNNDDGSAELSIFSSASSKEFDDRDRKHFLKLQERVRSDKNMNMPLNNQRPICFTPKSYANWASSKPSCMKYSANSADDERVFKAIMNSSNGKQRISSISIGEKHNDKASIAPVNSLFNLIGSTIDVIKGKMDFTDTSEVTMNENLFAPSCRKDTRNGEDEKGSTFRHICNYTVSDALENAPRNLQQKDPSDPLQGVNNARAEERSDVQQEWDKLALPSGWIMKRATKTGRAYYVHAGYGSTWYHPLHPPPSNAKLRLTEVPSALKRAVEESKCSISLKSKRLFDTEKKITGKRRLQDFVRPREGYSLQTKVRKKVWHHQACTLQRLSYLNR